jgi:predicted ATP-dependent endonuclease of OLD family
MNAKVLLVEGKDEKLVIPELMKANGVDLESAESPIVFINDQNGFDNIVKPDVIATELLASGLVAIGIIFDADEKPKKDRWRSVRNICRKIEGMPNLPQELPEEGLIVDMLNGIKFGIWMMPDNKMRGMLETFLADIISEENQEIWEFAKQSVNEAKIRGAKIKPNHIDKANIYTWLAWQEKPAQQIGIAVKKKTIFDPTHSNAQKFVKWFKDLYGL